MSKTQVAEALAIEPLYDKIIVKMDTARKEVTDGGIIIPDVAKEKPNKGTVVAVGTGRLLQDGNVYPMTIRVGDRVLVSRWAGSAVMMSDQDEKDEFKIMREDEVLARFKS